jgi:hypothetical protein
MSPKLRLKLKRPARPIRIEFIDNAQSLAFTGAEGNLRDDGVAS